MQTRRKIMKEQDKEVVEMIKFGKVPVEVSYD